MTDWTEPGADEVADGVYRIPLPLPNDGLRAVNVYVITGPDGLVLVDSGWALADARDQLVDSLKLIGADLGDVRRFLITHVHRDHYTQAIALRREYNSPVALGRGEAPSLAILAAPGHRALAVQLACMREWGATPLADRLRIMRDESAQSRDDASIWEQPDEWLADQQLITAGERSLQAIETPGHTAGHLVYRDTVGSLLFAGDHVLPTITPSIGLEPAPAGNPLRSFLASLALIRRLPDTQLLPAHGPVTASVHTRIDELLAHHTLRLDNTAAAAHDDATVYEVASRLRWTRRERTLEELDEFNQMLAIGETAAHLELLISQGRVIEIRDDATGGIGGDGGIGRDAEAGSGVVPRYRAT